MLEEERMKFENELKVQRAQSDADSEWLRREERAFSVSNGKSSENKDNKIAVCQLNFIFFLSNPCIIFPCDYS